MEVIKPGMFHFFYTDVVREQFDKRNEKIIQEQRVIDYVFLGDSITRALPTHRLSREKMIVNSGVNGDQTPYMLKRFMADAIQLKPKKIMLLGGINDLNAWIRGESYRGFSEEEIIKEITGNLREMAKLAQEYGVEMYLSSILPIRGLQGNEVEKRETANINELIRRTNRLLEKIASEQEVGYLNYYPLFLDTETKELIAEITEDGLHLNEAGYLKMLTVLKAAGL